MEPLIPMSKITSEAEWIGKMLLKIKDIKTEEDLKNFKGLRITLKSLLAYNCFNLIYEIKAYLISLGIPKETIEKYGGPYFHEGYFCYKNLHHFGEMILFVLQYFHYFQRFL